MRKIDVWAIHRIAVSGFFRYYVQRLRTGDSLNRPEVTITGVTFT
ncbi:MAG: hypothetical protein FD123_3848 [Bacteroidetes bacterium]|nr:MAG: hypothetical protein FD123_3848 [Bacteroidota bacterium]